MQIYKFYTTVSYKKDKDYTTVSYNFILIILSNLLSVD